VQNNIWLKVDYLWVWCLIGLLVLALSLAAIGATVFQVKKATGAARDDAFMDMTDDMENDFGAMAFSVCFCMFLRFVITGHHPVDDETEFDHTQSDRNWMLFTAFCNLIIAFFAVPYCSRQVKNYTAQRVMNFLSTVFAMNVAWSFFYWGEWEFFESMYKHDPIFGRVCFALLTTVLGCGGIFVLARFRMPSGTKQAKVALTALGLMVAWSWELCFDAAIDDMCEGRSHPALYKMGAAVIMFAVVIPVYAMYMKPLTMPAADAIGA